MKRSNKEVHLRNIINIFSSFESFIFVNFQKIVVSQFFDLRRKLKAINSSLMVVKNSVTKIALNDSNSKIKGMKQQRLKGPVFVVYSTDLMSAAKILVKFVNQNKENVSVICASFNNEILDAKDVLYYANLPSLDQLRIQLMHLIAYSIPARLALCLKEAREAKKASG